MSETNPVEGVLAQLRAMPNAEDIRIDESMRRLQWNENAEGFPAELKEEALARLAQMDWARYPLQVRPFELCKRIGEHLGVAAENIVVTGGSSEAIALVLGAFLSANDTIVMPVPTFPIYKRYIRQSGANLVTVQLRAEDGFAMPVDDVIVAARTNEAKVVLLCSPNNPTGTVHSIEDLERIADESGSVVILDAAYVEFSPVDLMPLVRSRPNIVMLRTFSKAYSMAGVRVGYVVAHSEIAANLQKVVPAFPIGVFQEMCATLALDHADRFMQGVANVIAERERIAKALGAIPGVTVYPSGTNFLLVEPRMAGAEVIEHTQTRHRMLLSDVSAQPGLDGFVRISVGSREENDLLIQGFREVFEA